MKKILFLMCLIISAEMGLGQSNFKAGYYITTQGDTVKGLIDFRTDLTNAEICKYKQTETAKLQLFHPGEIDSYRFLEEGKYYVSRTVVIDSVAKQYFLEFLVQGLMNLYYLPLDEGYYFFEDEEGNMMSITKKPDEILNNKTIREDNRYKGVMSYVFRDYMPLALETKEADFSKGTIIKYTKKYHEKVCTSGESCIIFENDYKKKFTKVDFSILTGFEFNSVTLSGSGYTPMWSFSPVAGAGIHLSSPRFNSNLSVYGEISLSGIAGIYDLANNNTSYSVFKFNGNKTSIHTGLAYVFLKGRIRPVISGGFSRGILWGMQNTVTTNQISYQNTKHFEENLQGVHAAAGFNYSIKRDQIINCRFMFMSLENADKHYTYSLNLTYKF